MREPDTWRTETGVPRLEPGEVHVWRVSLNVGLDRIEASLSPEERRRRGAFFDVQHGRRWGLARGALRALLGAYTGQPPGSLRFARGRYGKPFLRGGDAAFSVSHTDDVALYAVARDLQVGVDIERIAPERASQVVADAFMDARESTYLRSCAGDRRAREFFRLWTRREAFLKARGTGWPDEATTLEDAGRPSSWLYDLPLGRAHAGAVAGEGGACRLRLFDLKLPVRATAPHP